MDRSRREADLTGAFGEDELVRVLGRLLGGQVPDVRLGIGDDAALVWIGDHLTVLTTDLLVEGVHFRLGSISARDLGAKALTANVSDVAAMGGSPRFALVSLGLPRATAPSWVVELYGGLRDAASEYALTIVGGDTSMSKEVLISIAVVGEVADGAFLTRAGARPGERIVVTGSLGGAAGGLLLEEQEPGRAQRLIGSGWARELLQAHLRPVARVGEGQTLAASGATAMMDVSDGLSKDLARLCLESGVAGVVRLSDVPLAPALARLREALGSDPLELGLSGGEDYELLATMPAGSVESARAMLMERFGTPLTDIGEIRDGVGLIAVEADGSEHPLAPGGWDHFG